MQQRKAFIEEYLKKEPSVSELCRRFEVSRKTAYKWIDRFMGGCELVDRSRRPHSSPRAITEALEDAIVKARRERPHWGPKKLRAAAEHYQRSYRPLPQPAWGRDFLYPDDFETARVRKSGSLPWNDHSTFVSTTLKHELLGLQWQHDGAWRVYFGALPLGTLSRHGRSFAFSSF